MVVPLQGWPVLMAVGTVAGRPHPSLDYSASLRITPLQSGAGGWRSWGSGSHWVTGLGLSRLSALSSFSSLWAVSSEMGAGGGDGVLSFCVVGVDAWVGSDGASALTVGRVLDAGDVGVEVALPALPVLPLEVANCVLTSPALGCGCLTQVLPMGGDWVVLTVRERLGCWQGSR